MLPKRGNTLNDKNWFVVYTKPRKEFIAVENLVRQGFTAYCPQTIQPKRRRKRWQNVSEPLFPRYLFVRMGMNNLALIRSTLGLVGLVRFGNEPAVVPQMVIEAIQRQEQEINKDGIEHPRWKKGLF
ncbi:MAG: hypothetical protein GC149_06960 [Gammaproteobacteria bacterium]|nr:hypothetical protein [Gammaproteobacteria bacterium]